MKPRPLGPLVTCRPPGGHVGVPVLVRAIVTTVGWIFLVLLVAVPILYLWVVARLRRNFDEMIKPADDLRRADDGGTQSLGMRDGTGGLV